MDANQSGSTKGLGHGLEERQEEGRVHIDRARSRSVRLIISIPVLTLLLVLVSGLVYYAYLNNFAETEDLSMAARQGLEGTALRMLHLTVALSLLAAVVGYLLAIQITRPIRELAGTMEALAAGDLSRKIQPIPLGEFGHLGATFNRMVEELNHLFEERDRQLRQSFGGVHLVVSTRGDVLQADASAERVFGRAPAEICGRNLLEPEAGIPLLERNPRLLEALGDLIRSGELGSRENRLVPIRGAEGQTQTRFLVSCMPLGARENAAPTLLLIIRDAQEISTFYEQMQRADRLAALGTLSTGIAHEIRNPLAAIRGMVQLLSEDAAAESQSPTAMHNRILKEVDRLNDLVEGIMTFGQAENTQPEAVDLNTLMREAAEGALQRVPAANSTVDVEYDLDEALPITHVQVNRMRQALLNLAINALQHCVERQGGTVRFQTMHLPVNQQRPVILCVANSGDPIPEEQRERLFEPFYTTKADGTGLGLPITYQSVLANSGVLELECEDGEVQFWIRLPLDARQSRSAVRILPSEHNATPYFPEAHS